MKEIILAQHGQANNDSHSGPNSDCNRLLTMEGIIKATDVSQEIASFCQRKGFSVQLLCSPAYRTIVEAYMIAGILNLDKNDVQINQFFYQENKRLISGCLNYVNNLGSDCPIIVSHIPTVPLLVYALTRHTQKEITEGDLDAFYSQNTFNNLDEYMKSGEVPFEKGNAYNLVIDNEGKGHLDKVFDGKSLR